MLRSSYQIRFQLLFYILQKRISITVDHILYILIYDLNRYEDAIQCYDQAIKLDSSDYKVFSNKGLALQLITVVYTIIEFESVRGCYLMLRSSYQIRFQRPCSIQIQRISITVDLNVYILICNLNRYEEAISCYNKALTIDPSNDIAKIKKDIALKKINKRRHNKIEK